MNVYAVWSGCYSDKEVVAVFSTQENAQAYIDECAKPVDEDAEDSGERLDEPWIASYPLDAEVPPSADHSRYLVKMGVDGDVIEVTAKHWGGGPIRRRGDGGARWFVYPGYADSMQTVVWARDAEHAVKVANERRVMSIANGELEKVRREQREAEERRKAR